MTKRDAFQAPPRAQLCILRRARSKYYKSSLRRRTWEVWRVTARLPFLIVACASTTVAAASCNRDPPAIRADRSYALPTEPSTGYADSGGADSAAVDLAFSIIRHALANLDVSSCAAGNLGDTEVIMALSPSGEYAVERFSALSFGYDEACIRRKVRFRVASIGSMPTPLRVLLTARETGYGALRYRKDTVVGLSADFDDAGLKPPVLGHGAVIWSP